MNRVARRAGADPPPGRCRRLRAGPADRGAVTVEAAFALGAFAVVLLAALAGVAAAATEVHCVDAAREAARAAALGDAAGAHRVAAEIAPGAAVLIHRDGGELRVEVTAPPSRLLPGVHPHAVAYAVLETGTATEPEPLPPSRATRPSS